MPLNLVKIFPALLEFAHLNEGGRKASLLGIFNRDIQENASFKFRGKIIKPIKKEGQNEMDTLFTHLTCEDTIIEEGHNKYRKRVFELDRSQRLHWILPHIEERAQGEIFVFSVNERDTRRREDVIKTYIYNRTHKYVIVLLPQRSPTHYYLLTAYHLNKPEGVKTIEKKLERRLE